MVGSLVEYVDNPTASLNSSLESSIFSVTSEVFLSTTNIVSCSYIIPRR